MIMKQYEVKIKSKTNQAVYTVNVTCSSEVKAMVIVDQEYRGFVVLGVIATREAHYFYNEIDASK